MPEEHVTTGSAVTPTLGARLAAEAIGMAFLLAGVVGSGIAAERLSPDPGVQLLVNSFATAGVLVALIVAFGSVSAQFNPVVTLIEVIERRLSPRDGLVLVAAQQLGAIGGVIAANLMFGLSAINVSQRNRSDGRLVLAEGVATLGLLLIVFLAARRNEPVFVAVAVAGYIAGAYFFTSSTSFANPAVTIARTLSNTFAGIRPSSAPAFVVAQVAAVPLAVGLLRLLRRTVRPTGSRDLAERSG